jgi:hypothetical protein
MSKTDPQWIAQGGASTADYMRWSGTLWVPGELAIVDDTTPQLGGTLDCQNKDLDNIKTATFNAEFDNGNESGTFLLVWTSGQKQKATLTGDITTLTITDPVGPCNLTLKLVQDATGGRSVTWPASVLWPGGTGPTLSGASATDLVSFYFDGTNYHAQAALDFS